MRISDIKNSTVPYFKGNFAPVQQEHNEPCLEIIGAVPQALNGAFLRIGATRCSLMTRSLIIPSLAME